MSSRLASSKPRNVAPFANGDLVGPSAWSLGPKCGGNVPYEGGAKAARKRGEALGPPDGADAVEGRLVFLPILGGEAVRLHAGLDHVDGVDDGPQLCVHIA